jgi:hypothetical protein
MGKVVMFTGISSGYGKKNARLLAAKGHVGYNTLSIYKVIIFFWFAKFV